MRSFLKAMKEKLTLFFTFILCLIIIITLFAGCNSTTPVSKNLTFNEKNPGEITFEKTPEENIIVDSDSGLVYANNELLVVAEPKAKKSKIEKLAQEYDATIIGYIEVTGDYQWRLNKTYTEEELNKLIDELNNNELITEVTLNLFYAVEESAFYTPDDDPEWKGIWDKYNPDGSNWGVEAIHVPWAWDYRDKMTEINVGLIDNEFDTGHEDLKDSFVETFYNTSQNALSDAHGTHVAGTFAAGFNNKVGITGVYPHARGHLYGTSVNGLMSYAKNTSKGLLSSVGYKCAFAELIVRNVKVINVSLSAGYEVAFAADQTQYKDESSKAIQYIQSNGNIIKEFLKRLLEYGYDFVIVSAAGNNNNARTFNKVAISEQHPFGWEYMEDGSGTTTAECTAKNNSFLNYIEDSDSENNIQRRIIVVGAAKLKNSSNPSNRYLKAEFSNVGDRVDIMAPGDDITSTVLNNKYEGGWSGTSMAAPHVTGVAAMVWSFNTNLTGSRVKEIVMESSNGSFHTVEGSNRGMVDALSALAIAAEGKNGTNPFESQNAIILSTVSKKNGDGIKNAKIEAFSQSSGTSVATATTDSDGQFDIVLPEGTYELKISANGYNDKAENDITVKNGEVLYLNTIVLGEALKDFTIPSDLVVTLGEVYAIEPETTPKDASGYTLHWTSSNEDVATVSPEGETGIISSISKGTTKITATLNTGGKTITKTTNLRIASKGRDTVLVLDVSGSMDGEPIEEMKKSAINFCNDLLTDEYNNRVGIAYYDSFVDTVDLTNDLDQLKYEINSLSSGSSTNMEGGMAAAKEMLDAQGKSDNIKNIVVMADGLPNQGNTNTSGPFGASTGAGWFYEDTAEYANAVVDTADKIKKDYNLYSLGFFHSIDDSEKDDAIELMQLIASSDNDYYNVNKAEDLQFAFGDIAESISNGSKIVINIACPVDVTVSYEGETLSSAADSYDDTASFGALQLLGKDKDIKVLSLDSDKDYEVSLTGTDAGTMDYSVNYFDENDSLVDYRSFYAVPITTTTAIASNTNNTATVCLEIDSDGDGVIDSVWEAKQKSTGTVTSNSAEPTEPSEASPPQQEPEKNNDSSTLIIVLVVICVLLMGAVTIIIVATKSKYSSNSDEIPIKEPDIEGKDEVPTYSSAISILTGSQKGTIVPIKDGETFTLGKDPKTAQIVFANDYNKVSRIHCTITYNQEQNKYFVTDCSSNGTYSDNNVEFEKSKRIAVAPNSVIVLADKNCMVLLK